MKLTTNTQKAILTNVGEQGEFSIKNSAHAFKILSSGLYSNKIKAIVRELSCNAIDSHIEANTLDIPFEVHLPNQLEPYFSVRDYGVGLNHEEVTQIYTTYFESTKQESNDYIGALGLGSKSPFSYTDNFTVTTIKDGVQRIYSAFINDAGCPGIVLMGESESDLGNGVEVKFSVSAQSDINKFCNEAEGIFRWFEHKPDVSGNSSYCVRETEYSFRNVVPGVHLRKNAGYNRNYPIAIQGNIAYPVKIPASDEFDDIKRLFNIPLVLEFNIGDLDISASREELSYIPLTIENIVTKLRTVNDEISRYVKADVDKIDNEWEKAYAIFKYESESLFSSGARECVKDSGCKLLTVSDYSSITRAVDFSDSELIESGVKLSVIKVAYSYSSSSYVAIKVKTRYINDKSGDMHSIPISPDVVFVTNSTLKGAQTRCKNHFRVRSVNKTIILVELASKEFSYSVIEAFLGKLCNPEIIDFDSLDKPEKVATFKTGFALFTYENVSRSWWNERYEWKWKRITYEIINDPNKTFYYVPLAGYDPVDENGDVISDLGYTLWPAVSNLGIFEKGTPIYGVRKSRIKDIEGASNWVPALGVVKDFLAKFDQGDIEKYICTTRCRAYVVYDSKISEQSAAVLSSDSVFGQFTSKVQESRIFEDKARKKMNSFMLLAKWNNIPCSVDVDKINRELAEEYKAILEKYPMLALIENITSYSSDLISKIINYVHMMDEKEKEND